MEDEDPGKAMEILLARYEDKQAQASAIVSQVANIRRHILLNNSYRRPGYTEEIRALMKGMNEWSEDYQRLQRLLTFSLLKQHSVYMDKKPFLENQEANKTLKLIRPCKAALYDFKTPKDIYTSHHKNVRERVRAQQFHRLKEREHYTFSITEAETYIQKARSVLQQPILSPETYYDIAAALCLLSGRRNFEILKELSIQPGKTEYQARVYGLCKKQVQGRPDCEGVDIPLLCPYWEFEFGLATLRNFRDWIDEPNSARISGKTSRGISNACFRLFGRKLSHTQKRNIYSEMAYLNKENNGFLVGEESCSKNFWIASALGHTLPSPCVTNRYQIMTMSL